MSEYGSRVTTEKGGPSAGYAANVITPPNSKTDPKDTAQALRVVGAFATYCKGKCELPDCNAKVIGVMHGDGEKGPKIITYSVRCEGDCTSGLPTHTVPGEFVVTPDYIAPSDQ